MIGIYKIVNIINNKCYIGSSNNIERRFYRHKWHLNNNHHDNPYLQNAWNKYGEENFIFQPISFCKEEELLYHEQQLINKLKPEYNFNLKTFRPPSWKGKKLTKEHINKIRDSRIRGGKKWSQASRDKMSKSTKGVPKPNNHSIKTIYQIELGTNRVLNTFKSVIEAARYINKDKATKIKDGIAKCATGVNATAYGYFWLYKKQINKQLLIQ